MRRLNARKDEPITNSAECAAIWNEMVADEGDGKAGFGGAGAEILGLEAVQLVLELL